MPFNQLLLPLLGGYLLVNFTYISSYWASRQSKEQLILLSALAGLFVLLVARSIVLLVLLTSWGQALGAAVHVAAPYPGIGTALLAFALCIALLFWINAVWPKEEAALWLYGSGTYNSLETLFFLSVLRVVEVPTRKFPIELLTRMFPIAAIVRKIVELVRNGPPPSTVQLDTPDALDSMESNEGRVQPIPVMLSLRDRKVYIGWLQWVPPLRADNAPYLKIVPILSGVRDPNTLKFQITEDYSADKFEESPVPNARVISIGDIAHAGLFDEDVFTRFSSHREDGLKLAVAGKQQQSSALGRLIRRIGAALK